MNVRSHRKMWLAVASLPLSFGALTTRAARAQSVPPLRQSVPPRVLSLPPARCGRRSAARASMAAPALAAAPAAADADEAQDCPPTASLAELTARANAPVAPQAPSIGASPDPSPEAAPQADAPAQPAASEPAPPSGYFAGAYLTTDWGGARPWLQEHGVDLFLRYTSEGFARVRGGAATSDARAFLGSFVAGVDVDTGVLGAWKGGTLHAHMQALHGDGVSAKHLGVLQSASNLEAERFATLAEVWYRHEFFDGKLALKVGKQDASVDFAASDFASGLLNASFGVFPTLALTTYPQWGLGVAAFVTPAKWLTVQTAIYDGAPDGNAPLGGTTAFDAEGGHLLVGEVQLHLAPLLGLASGTLRLGGWRHTGDAPALQASADDTSERTFAGNYGAYGILDAKLYGPSGEGREGEGLGVFLQAGVAPEDRNETRMYLGGGLAFTGAIPGRSADVASLGVGHAEMAGAVRALEDRTSETVVELSYRAPITGAISVQPDAQYFVRPSGDGGVPNAAVVGIRMVASL